MLIKNAIKEFADKIFRVNDCVRAKEILNEQHQKGEPIDMIIISWDMVVSELDPFNNPETLIMMIRRDKRFDYVSILVSSIDPKNEQRALCSKASGFITSPFSQGDIENKVKQMFKDKEGELFEKKIEAKSSQKKMMKKSDRVMIVDGLPIMRKTLKRNLQMVGFALKDEDSVIEAENCDVAYNSLVELHTMKGIVPDLIISEYNFNSGANGVEFFHKLKKDDRFSDIPFMLVTTDNSDDTKAYARQVGIKTYIVKPCTPKELEEYLLIS